MTIRTRAWRMFEHGDQALFNNAVAESDMPIATWLPSRKDGGER
jgi:hypothetical protein